MFKNIKVFDSEIELWCSLWKERKIEKEALQQLERLGLTDVVKEAGNFFPQIQKALIILLLTLPFTTATIERTFSTLRRVKNWLRSIMVEELNGLCMLSVHRKILLERKLIVKEKVSEVFCEPKRRLSLK